MARKVVVLPAPLAPSSLNTGKIASLPAVLALPLSLLFVVVVGAVTEFVVYRPLRNSAPLAKLVASLGVLLVAQASMLLAFGVTDQPEPGILPQNDPWEMFADAAIMREEAAALARMGCTYVQIDSPDLGTLIDPENRQLRESLGMPTERTLTEGVDIINSVGDVPGVTFGLHLCKGNYESKWIAAGGYDSTADKIFSWMSNFDVFLLEYDDERSGSFEPLASVPDDKLVILGLVSSKWAEMEPAETLVARINEAARCVDLERLGISTQCGFSPVSIGANLITQDVQQRKLELVGQVVRQVWQPRRLSVARPVYRAGHLRADE